MSYIRNKEYEKERERPNILTNYLQQMTKYLQLRHPTMSQETIDAFVKKKISERFQPPEVEALHHKREGTTEEIRTRLDHFYRDVIADNNLSPSGSCYHPVSRKESFLRISIDGKVKERNEFKHKYLDFEAQGLKREAQYYYQNQANAKIFNNAIAGGMGTKQFILGDKAGFNAITSVGRISVKQGYSYIERALNANIYLPTVNDAVSYAINHARHIPQDFYPLILDKVLYVPTVQDVMEYLINSVSNYTTDLKADSLETVLSNMLDVERAYVFYAGCLNNLCRFNETLMRTWIDSCFLPDHFEQDLYNHIQETIDPADIKKIHGDIVNAILATDYKQLGRNPEKKNRWNSIKDAAKYNVPGLKAFIYRCQHFVKNFESNLSVIKPILQVQTTFSRLVFQQKMARFSVPLSDTDSNIFSTQELIRWKSGKIDFSQQSYQMNAITVLLLSQTLEHVFARLSAGMGVETKDVFRISMKNEFLFPVTIVTALAKHYIAIATMQEGSLLPNPRKEIKGVNLRNSAYPKLVRDNFEAFMVDLFAEIQKGEQIKAGDILRHIATLEKTIYDSVMQRESQYLQTVTVRVKEDYTDPEQSSYFYYELWNEIFAAEFGEMPIPNKCYRIPLKNGRKLFKDPVFMANLEKDHPVIFKNLTGFLERNPKRNITYILVPPSKGPLQQLFVDMMDTRNHISQILSGFYIVLEALGIGSTNRDGDALVSDYYDPSTVLLS